VRLEWLAEMSEDEIRRSLADLQTAEFLYEARLFPDLEYTFKHALTHEVAYGSLLQDRRRTLHAALVEAIERLYAGRVVEHIEILAHHAVRGGLGIEAARYLRQAGEKAVARSANREAIEFLEQALALLAGLPEEPATLAEILETRITLGPALTSVKGSGSSEVETLYLSALELVGRLGDDSRLFPVLWGLWYSNYGRGRYPAAREMGERLLAAAQKGNDSGQLLEAHHALWPTLSAMGQPTAAVLHAERGLALYERERHAAQAFVYGNHDPGACCRYHLALGRWLLGYPDRSFTVLQDTLRLVEELKHPPTTVIALWFTGWVYYQRGDRETAAATADRQLALATEHGIASWIDAALLLSHLRADGRPSVPTLTELHHRYVSAWSGGAPWRLVFCLCVLADLFARAGHPEEALGALASIPEEARNAFYAPEIHRMQGELLLQRPLSAIEDAERCFRTAIDLARQRSEKSLELRAAMSLARLWQRQGKRDEARRLLTEVYGWFTEGFETADLRDARALLAQL